MNFYKAEISLQEESTYFTLSSKVQNNSFSTFPKIKISDYGEK